MKEKEWKKQTHFLSSMYIFDDNSTSLFAQLDLNKEVEKWKVGGREYF